MNGCSAEDLSCQCTPETQAGIALAGGPCLLGSCAVSELSSFSSAWTAACATASATNGGSSPQSATAAEATFEGASSGQKMSELGAIQTGATQEDTGQVMGSVTEVSRNSTQLGPAAITAIAVGLVMIGVGIGVLVYYCSIMPKRRIEKQHWEQLERERTAMQASLEELRRAVSRQGTFDMAEDKGTNRPKTILVNWKEGPQELMVPEKVYYELPA